MITRVFLHNLMSCSNKPDVNSGRSRIDAVKYDQLTDSHGLIIICLNLELRARDFSKL